MSAPTQPPGAGASETTAGHARRGPVVWTRNKFLAGFALALPLVVTWWILLFIYNILHGWSEPLLRFVADLTNEMAGHTVLNTEDPVFQLVARCVGVIIPVAFLIGLGVMATNVIGVRIVAAVDQLLLRIPIISFIYKSLKQVIDAFKSLGAAQNFKRVAYIDYPVPGMRMIGFVTGQFTDRVSGKAMTSVFLPTAPNPMTGLLLVVDSEKVTDAAITLEEATKMIFSGGLVAPEGSAPLNQRPNDVAMDDAVTEESPVLATDEAVQEPAATADKRESAEASYERLLPMLPRAEDFDSGDPDILASISEVDGGRRGAARRWLPWIRR